MRYRDLPPAGGAFPPRAVAFCRAMMTALFATLSLAGLILLIGGLVVLQSARPGFGQEPAGPAGHEPPSASRGLAP